MTATPIPRTLAITAFGDMDVSTLRELPKGRKPIKTYWVQHDMLDRVLGFIRREVAAGRQAYVICPLIEESDKLDVQNAIDLHIQLQQAFPGFAGRAAARPDDARRRRKRSCALSRAGEVHVLVSTTVIEVGVDVPNATLMVIMDADRFGLSQLHQLRGRVGRGDAPVLLRADRRSEDGGRPGADADMTETDDGFEIVAARSGAARAGRILRHEAERRAGFQGGGSVVRFRGAGDGAGRCGGTGVAGGVLARSRLRAAARDADAGSGLPGRTARLNYFRPKFAADDNCADADVIS